MIQRIEIPLVGGHYIGRSTNVDAQKCINLYPVIDNSGGRPMSLQPVPGLKTWKNLMQSDVPIRAMYKFSTTVAYVIAGRTVYKLDTSANATALAVILDNSDGPCQLVDNGTQIMILDITDGKGYVIESDVVTKIADLDYPLSSSLTYQDGYAIVSQKDSKKFSISTLDTASVAAYNASDFTRWATLDFASVGGLTSNLGAVVSDHDELWMMGTDQTGYYYNSSGTFTFSKAQHPFQEAGLGGSPLCIVKLDNSLFWLDSWNTVRRAAGYTPVIISTPEVSYNIEQFSTISDATAFGYRQEGQFFYVLNFPTANKTYVYDVSTGFWHLRSSGLNEGRWRPSCYMDFAGKHLFGDYKDAVIYEGDHDLYTDAGNAFRAVRTTRFIDAQRKKAKMHRLELHMETGVSNTNAPGNDAQVMMKYSDDGGHNWSREHWRPIGKQGKYKDRVIWRKLGSSRERIFQFEITDPVDRVLIGLYADVTLGYS